MLEDCDQKGEIHTDGIKLSERERTRCWRTVTWEARPTVRTKVFSGSLWLGVEIYTERTKMFEDSDLGR